MIMMTTVLDSLTLVQYCLSKYHTGKCIYRLSTVLYPTVTTVKDNGTMKRKCKVEKVF
jgi:hypothetical protein